MTTILLIEDDPTNSLIFYKFLTKAGGFKVKATENVDEILSLAESQAVDLVLMDISLPDSVYDGKPIDGIRITQLLKKNPKTANIPVILLTAHAMTGDRETNLKLSGADGYVTKPVLSYPKLFDYIHKVIAAKNN